MFHTMDKLNVHGCKLNPGTPTMLHTEEIIYIEVTDCD